MYICLISGKLINRSVSESNYFVKIFHPVTSTVIAPVLVLILLNIKTFKKIPISQSTNDRSRKAARWVISLVIWKCSSKRESFVFLFSYISFRQREISFVKICSLIVIVFIVCNLPRLAIGLFEISRYLGRRIWLKHKKFSLNAGFLSFSTVPKTTFSTLLQWSSG